MWTRSRRFSCSQPAWCIYPAVIFAPDYLLHYFRNRYPAGRYAMLHFALMASVALILTAGDALTFLISWECMSILCYLLVNYEQKQQT